MQGSKISLIVGGMIGVSLTGCVVHQHQAPASAQQEQQSQQSAARNAKAAPTTKTAVAPSHAPAPAPQRPAPPPAAAGRTYTIRPGDNLWNISKDVYGDGTKYQRILDANPGLNPDNMKPGTKIVIP